MNDAVPDTENGALTHEEAVQVLRLSPEGLRRLADLDEAITELKAARRSLLANRLESIRDAFAAARTGRSTAGGEAGWAGRDEQPVGDGSDPEPAVGRDGRHEQEAIPGSGQSAGTPASSPRIGINGAAGREDAVIQAPAPGLEGELRRLRGEVTELRRELASVRGSGGGSEAELQQINRRLSYLEAELESRQI